MSMIGNLLRLPAATCEQLQRQPELIHAFLYPESLGMVIQPKPGWFARFFGQAKPAPPAPPPKPFATRSPQDALDLDKAWHGLHFLFTGSDWEGDFPQGFLVSCGDPVGEEDVGYGPARAFGPEAVQQLAVFLNAQSEEELRRRFDPKKMKELDIYPSIWASSKNPDNECEFLLDGYRQLKQFVQEAAAQRLALLVFLN